MFLCPFAVVLSLGVPCHDNCVEKYGAIDRVVTPDDSSSGDSVEPNWIEDWMSNSAGDDQGTALACHLGCICEIKSSINSCVDWCSSQQQVSDFTLFGHNNIGSSSGTIVRRYLGTFYSSRQNQNSRLKSRVRYSRYTDSLSGAVYGQLSPSFFDDFATKASCLEGCAASLGCSEECPPGRFNHLGTCR